MPTIFFIQFAIVLLRILIDAQAGGIGLGVPGGVGLAVLAFGFYLGPISPSIDVMLMITAVAFAAASMQVSGGSDYMIKVVTCMLHRNPKYIIFIVPVITYLLTVSVDMGYVTYSVLPVITEVSRRNGIRPSHPLAMAVIASQFTIVASPIATAVVACVTYLEPQYITTANVLKATVPSTALSIGLACVFVNRLGKELKDDPHYQKLLAKPEYVKAHEKDPTEYINPTVSPQAKLSVGIFFIAMLLVVVTGAVLESRPTFQTEEGPKLMGTAHTIEIVMLPAATLIILFHKPDGNAITRGSVFHVRMCAVIAVFGVVQLGDTPMCGHLAEVKDIVSYLVEAASWAFVAILLILSVLVNSQDATVATLFPIVISLNIPVPVTTGTFVVANGYFFIPNYGPVIAAIDFDSTGPTKIGRYIFDHSFMIPELLSLIFSLILGLAFAEALLRI